MLQARHEALWDDLIERMNVVARPVVQNFAKAVSKAHDHDEYCKIYYDYSKKINQGSELYDLLLKNGFSKDDIDRYRHEYIKELNRIYLATPALYEEDYSSDGFDWVAINDMMHNVYGIRRNAKQVALSLELVNILKSKIKISK